jgi:DNA-binding CsgD family transcriptional regulator
VRKHSRWQVLPTKRVLSGLLGTLYDAAANPELWDVFLRGFVRPVHANSAALLVHHFNDSRHNITRQFGLNPDDVRIYYNESNELEDVWAANARPRSHAGWTHVSESLSPSGVLVGTPFYNECLKKLHIFHAMFGVVEQKGPITAIISLYRKKNATAFEVSDLELLDFFMPHLRRAFQLHFRLADLQTQSISLQAAVDMSPTGMIFFDSAGKILCMNRTASAVVSQKDGLLTIRQGLRAEHSPESAHLELLIRQATAISVGGGLHPGGAILISRRYLPPLHLLVVPLRNLQLGLSISASAVVFVVDPSRRLRPVAEMLSGLFRLTPAECRVALLLGDGKSVAEIAQILGVTRNTLKTQIACVYSKTGTSRQSQLARLLAQFPQSDCGPIQK